jgi:hypothetical protein
MTKEPKTKTALSEADISGLKKNVSNIRSYMCSIADRVSTPKIQRGCTMSNDLENLISDMTPEKASPKVIEDIHSSLSEMCDIAIGIEVGSESIISDVRKTKRQYHDAKKRTIKPIKVYKE